MKELINFIKQFMDLYEGTELPNSEKLKNLLKKEEEGEFVLSTKNRLIDILKPYVYEMCWLSKKPEMHGEGTNFAHTILVMREIKTLPDSDDIDLVIAFFHDIAEYRVIKNKITELSNEIIYQFNKIDHSDVELIVNGLTELYIDRLDKSESLDLLGDEDIIKYVKDHPIKSLGHAEESALEFVRIYEQITPDSEFNQDLQGMIFYCINYHMQGYFIDKMRHKDEVELIVKSKYFDRLKRIWYADFNGRISKDPRISMEDINKRIMSNPIIVSLLKPKRRRIIIKK